jgi:hypothetical protein
MEVNKFWESLKTFIRSNASLFVGIVVGAAIAYTWFYYRYGEKIAEITESITEVQELLENNQCEIEEIELSTSAGIHVLARDNHERHLETKRMIRNYQRKKEENEVPPVPYVVPDSNDELIESIKSRFRND